MLGHTVAAYLAFKEIADCFPECLTTNQVLTSFEKRSSAGARRKKKELWNPVSVSLLLEAEVPLNQGEVRGTQGRQEKEG